MDPISFLNWILDPGRTTFVMFITALSNYFHTGTLEHNCRQFSVDLHAAM